MKTKTSRACGRFSPLRRRPAEDEENEELNTRSCSAFLLLLLLLRIQFDNGSGIIILSRCRVAACTRCRLS